jgi:poly-gamma-glutamate synthesis protein (capsule biosynthesis protein)
MAQENEELNRRRQRRERMKAHYQKQQRDLIIRLIAVAAVLLVSAVAIVVLSLPKEPASPAVTTTPAVTEGTSGSESTDPIPSTTAPGTVPTEETTPSDTTVIRFAAAGDLNITDQVVAAGGGAMDYAPAFVDVLPLLANADLTTLNLEGNLVGVPYGTATKSVPQSMLTALKNAGVDLIQMANSCSIYNGVAGLKQTLEGIRAAGLTSVGAFSGREEFRRTGGYTIRTVKGVKIAIVAFTKGMDSMGLPAGSEDCVNVLYKDYDSTYQKVDTEGIVSLLDAVAEERPDITIALVHWGSEFNDKISASQETIEKLLLRKGVSAIIGTHSHFVQQMKLDPKNGTFVAYSLGDFFGNGERAGTEYSVILELEITKDHDTGITKVTDFTTTPIFTVHEEEKPLRILRIREAIHAYEACYVDRVSEETYNDMVYALKRVEERINGK